MLETDVENVKDIIQVTGFLECATLDALEDPPSRWPHRILDLPSDVDLSRLQWSCERLVERFDVLHPVFARLGRQILVGDVARCQARI